MAPEILTEKGHNMAADWWAFGIVLYELATGDPPFNSKNLEQLADDICFQDLPLKNEFSRNFSDLLQRLLHKLPNSRLGGTKGAAEIKKHAFFKSVNWDDVLNKGMQPPIVPSATSQSDEDPNCPSLLNRNPYEMLANNFDKKVYD